MIGECKRELADAGPVSEAQSVPPAARRTATLITLLGSGANTALVSLQAVLLIPLYTHYIGTRLYGSWLGSGDLLVWLQAFDLGFPNLMIQRVGQAYGRGDQKSVCEWFASTMFALVIVGCMVGAAGMFISSRLANVLPVAGSEAAQLQMCFSLAAMVTGVLLMNNGMVGFSRAVQQTAVTNVATVVASVAGCLTSLWLVLHGRGLLAIPIGMAVRALVTSVGCLWFVISFFSDDLRAHLRVRLPILRELAVVSPATALGTLGYAVMNQSETFLAAALFRPELAVILNLTKKAADVGRSLVDMIGFASYGGFAHLVGSPQRRRALLVHHDINAVRISAALIVAVAYMCANGMVMRLWVGSAYYGGPLLTIVIGLHLIIAGGSYLTNYLYRAAGKVVNGSLMLIGESILRIPLMILFARYFNIPGLLLGGIITALLSMSLVQNWTVKLLSGFSEPLEPTSTSVWVTRAIIFSAGGLVCILSGAASPVLTASAAFATVSVGTATLLYTDKALRRTFAVYLQSVPLMRYRVAIS